MYWSLPDGNEFLTETPHTACPSIRAFQVPRESAGLKARKKVIRIRGIEPRATASSSGMRSMKGGNVGRYTISD